MKTIAIEGNLRENMGGNSAKQLRKEGQVPCVIYGGDDNIHFYTPENSFKDLLYTPEVFNVEIAIDGKKYNCVIRQAQYHPVTDLVEHVDFLELLPKKEVMIRVPVVLRGNAKGVRNGGRLKVNLRRLRVKAIPSGLPGQIEIDITDLKIGDTIRVEDIPVDGFIIDHEPSRAICLIQTARNIIEELEEEEEGEEGAEGAEEGATAEAEEGEGEAAEEPKAEG